MAIETLVAVLIASVTLRPAAAQDLMIIKWDVPIVCPQPVGGPCGPLSKT